MAEQRYSVDCWNCGGSGEIEGDCTCGDDCCCCLCPESPTCDECGGSGYLIVDELSADNCETAIPVARAEGRA